MIEKKFRSWNEVDKEMLYSDDYKEFYLFFQDAITGIIMLWTGLFDKSGKEIYEGDIVLYSMDDDDFLQKCIIRYYQNAFCVFNGDRFNNNIFSDAIEVISNIYQNPELLKDNK